MRLIVPMAGLGERFQRAGYRLPKPLIPVLGQPMISRVLARFRGMDEALLIVRDDVFDAHRAAFAEVAAAAPMTVRYAAVAPHRLGPVHSLRLAADHLDDRPSVVTMCDQDAPFDLDAFRSWFGAWDAAVVVYRGWHPHREGAPPYAHALADGSEVREVREKGCFTDDPVANLEPCSNGVYAFRRGTDVLALAAALGDEDRIGGEHYVSQLCDRAARQGRRVGLWETDLFAQWGTPEDLERYEALAATFRARTRGVSRSSRPHRPGVTVLPMAGFGSRFDALGLPWPKAAIPVGGAPMAVAALADLPATPATIVVLRDALPGREALEAAVARAVSGCSFVRLDAPTAGQAVTVLHAIDDLDDEAPVAIGVCDTGFDVDPEALDRAVAAHDVVAFTLADAPGARRDPRAYGWLVLDEAGRVVDVRVKEAPPDGARAQPFAGVVFARRTGPLRAALRALVARDGRVRGELYLDSSLNDLLAAGGSVAAFPVDAAHLWGTPVDLATWWYAAAWWTRMAPDVYDAAEDPRLSRHAARWLAQGSLPNSLHGWVLGPTESP